MTPDTALLYRDRSEGNCTYYRLTRPITGGLMSVVPVLSVRNSDTSSFAQIYRAPRTMVLNVFGMTRVSFRVMRRDFQATVDRMGSDVIGIRELIA